LYQCRKKAEDSEKNLGTVVNKIKGMSEDSFAFVWDKIPEEHHSLPGTSGTADGSSSNGPPVI